MTSGFSEFLGAKRERVPYHEHDASEVTGIGSLSLTGSYFDGQVGTPGALESPDFLSGVSGWRIAGDGTAEFQSVVVRGTLNADDITVGTLSVDRIADGSITGAKIGDGQISLNLFASTIEPIQVVGSLPGTATEGEMAYLTTDDKLYRYDGGAWIATIDGTDVVGQVATAGGIPTGGALPGTGSAGDLFFLTTDEKLYRHNGTAWILAVDGADVGTGTLPADKIVANSITTGQIQAGGIAADRLVANSITTTQIQAAGIDADRLVANSITAGEIQAGAIGASELAAINLEVGKYIQSTSYTPGVSGWSINADGSAEFQNVTVRGSLNATDLTAGTLSMDRIAAGDITGVKIGDDEITAGKIAALNLTVGKYIRSTSYTPGSAGWSIDANGSAEFNNVTVRGTIVATSGSISNLTINGALTLSGGVIRTASSGARWEMSDSFNQDIRWYNSSNQIVAEVGVVGLGLRLAGYLSHSISLSASGQISISSGSFVQVDSYLYTTSGNLIEGGGGVRGSNTGSAANCQIQLANATTGFYNSGGVIYFVSGGANVAVQGTGYHGPYSDNAIDSGASGARWRAIYMVGGVGSVNNVSRDANGRLTVASSSRRFKENIDYSAFDLGLDFIKTLRPVRFRWRDDDNISTAHPDRNDIGLIAEDVDALGADRLVTYDDEGPFSVRYDLMVVPLIKAIQELEARVAALEA